MGSIQTNGGAGELVVNRTSQSTRLVETSTVKFALLLPLMVKLGCPPMKPMVSMVGGAGGGTTVSVALLLVTLPAVFETTIE